MKVQMKFIKIFIILFLIFGCSSQKVNDNRISIFEEKLGDKETKTLNLLVSDFARIQIKYLENGKESSESAVVKRNSDRIILIINSKPKTIEKNEEYRFTIGDGTLKSIEFSYDEEVSTYKKL